MKLILGDEFGLIREVNTNGNSVIASYGEISRQREVVSIIKSPSCVSNGNMRLFITELRESYCLDWNVKAKLASTTISEPNIQFTSAIIKEVQGKHVVIASKSNSSLSILTYGDDYHLEKVDSIDNVLPNKRARLVKVESSSYRTNKEKEKGVVENIICLYEDSPLALYDITSKQFSWKAKNLPNDELGLVIPMHDTGACQLDSKPSSIYVCTAMGEIRTYDVNARNTPIASVNVSENKINRMVLVDENYLVIGDTKGYAALLDVRNNMNLVRSFKGITSSVKDIVHMKDSSLVAFCGFDRFVRWFDYKQGLNGHVYLKNKCTKMCFIEKICDENGEGESQEIDDEDIEEESQEIDDEDIEEESDQEKSSKKRPRIESDDDNYEDDDINKYVTKVKPNKKPKHF